MIYNVIIQPEPGQEKSLYRQICHAAAKSLAKMIKRNIMKTFHTTGRFPEGVRVEPAGDGYDVVIDRVYAEIQEFGGVINAKNHPYLVFKYNGQWVKKKSVTLPARPYVRPAIQELMSSMELIG